MASRLAVATRGDMPLLREIFEKKEEIHATQDELRSMARGACDAAMFNARLETSGFLSIGGEPASEGERGFIGQLNDRLGVTPGAHQAEVGLSFFDKILERLGIRTAKAVPVLRGPAPMWRLRRRWCASRYRSSTALRSSRN